MVEFTISADHLEARQRATIAFADTGVDNSRIHFYDSVNGLLATVILAKPCAEINAGVIKLQQESGIGDMILADGAAVSARWISGDDKLVALGAVSDETGVGPFVIQGTAGTQLYAGGRLVLGITEIE